MKKFLAILCALALCLMCATAMAEGESHPKYVFMFIGDGMGNPQVTATQYYLGSIENPDSKFPVPADLSFTKFPYLGLVTTYDSSSFCPDSASTATSMASGKKTLSGVINYDETLTNPYKIITAYAKEAGKKVGVITSVSVDHATPGGVLRQAALPQRLLRHFPSGADRHDRGLPRGRRLQEDERRGWSAEIPAGCRKGKRLGDSDNE